MQVRKYALKLLQQLVYTFSIIFEVRRGEGDKFPAHETVLADYEAAESHWLRVKDAFDALEIEVNQRKQKLMLDHPDEDPAQLQMIVSQNQ